MYQEPDTPNINIFKGKMTSRKVKRNMVVTYETLFGSDISEAIFAAIGYNRAKYLFKTIYPHEISFFAYFSLEVYEICYAMLNDEVVMERIDGIFFNRKAIMALMEDLKETPELRTMLYSGSSSSRNKKINDHVIKEVNQKYKAINLSKTMNFGILDHQEIVIRDYLEMKIRNNLLGLMVFAEPGTGKTFMSLALAEIMKSDRVIIVAPNKAVDSVWGESLRRSGMYKEEQEAWLTTDKRPYSGERFLVVNYEYLPKLSKMLEYNGGNTMFIFDESHNLNEKGTSRFKHITELYEVVKPTDVLLLSGTPIKGSTMEVSNILKFTSNEFTKEIEFVFENIYKSPTSLFKDILPRRYSKVSVFVSKSSLKLPDPITISDVVDLKNSKWYTIDAIRERMKQYAIKRITELEKEFPKAKKRFFELAATAYALASKQGLVASAYDEYLNNIDIIMSKYEQNLLSDIPNVIRSANAYEKEYIEGVLSNEEVKEFRAIKAVVKYASLKIQGEVLAHVVMRTRIELAKDFARELDYKKYIGLTKGKLLMFSSYGEVCEIAQESCNKVVPTLGIFWDSTPRLKKLVDDFHKDKNIGALVTTYKSLADAVPVTIADCTIFFDLPFRTYVYGQAMSRTHRLGQKNTCYFIQLLLDTGELPNINSRGVDIIKESKEMVEYITSKQVNIEFKELEVEVSESMHNDVSLDELMNTYSKIISGKPMPKNKNVYDLL